MTANIIVETQAEFDKWVNSQKSEYELAMGMGQPAGPTTNSNSADSTKSGAAAITGSKPVAVK